MAWEKNGTPDTLGSAGDTMQITDLTAKIFNVFLWHAIASGSISQSTRFNANSNSVYALRESGNGAGDTTKVSQTIIDSPLDFNADKFTVDYVCSISGEEKLGIRHTVFRQPVGAGNAPFRQELVYKFVPSPDADITGISFINDQSGSYDTDSNLSALGTD